MVVLKRNKHWPENIDSSKAFECVQYVNVGLSTPPLYGRV